MVSKILGYVIAVIGIIAIAATLIPQVKTTAPDIFIFDDLTLTIIGVVLVLIGLFLVYRSPRKQRKRNELPIYKGKEVVGYRRD
jgi:uncharacterized membrane protein YozB (DUF420 family)